MTKCTACGGDRDADMSEVKALIREKGVRTEMCDPGGRLLVFNDGARVRLSDFCNSCDIETLLRVLR